MSSGSREGAGSKARIAIISDLHFGDPNCVLVESTGAGWQLASGVEQALVPLQGIELLVLLGDIFDFSLVSYGEAFAAAWPFFELMKRIGVRQMLYCPGNHDSMLWHALEYETRVVRPVSQGAVPKPFRAALPAVVDARGGAIDIQLPGMHSPPGDVFLQSLMGKGVVVAFPNVYLTTETTTALLTHGQYFEPFWVVAGELFHAAAAGELPPPPDLTVKRIVEYNHPLGQLSCTGIGQAGELTDVVRGLQQEVRAHRVGPGTRVGGYLERTRGALVAFYEPVGSFAWLWRWLYRLALKLGMRFFQRKLAEVESARYQRSWLEKDSVRRRIRSFLRASRAELESMQAFAPASGPRPALSALVLGHTHEPIPWCSSVDLGAGEAIDVCNTGGWLGHAQAQILLCDGERFHSHVVWPEQQRASVSPAGAVPSLEARADRFATLPIVDLHAHLPMHIDASHVPGKAKQDFEALLGRIEDHHQYLLLMLGGTLAGNWYEGEPRVTLPKLCAGGVEVVCSALYDFFDEFDGADLNYDPQHGIHFDWPVPREKYFESILRQMDAVERRTAEFANGERAVVVRSWAELEQARGRGQLAVIHCLEGGFALGHRAEQITQNVEALARRGLAYVTLAHLLYRHIAGNVPPLPNLGPFGNGEKADDWCRKHLPVPAEAGLTPLGKALLRALVAQGVYLDLTHLDEHAMTHTLDYLDELDSERAVPVLVSHGAYRFHGRRYNLTPDQIERIARRRGLIGVLLCEDFLLDDRALEPSLERFSEHVLAIVDVIRQRVPEAEPFEHLAIGTDLDGFIVPLAGVETSARMQHLAHHLESRVPGAAAAVCSGNAYRLLSEGARQGSLVGNRTPWAPVPPLRGAGSS